MINYNMAKKYSPSLLLSKEMIKRNVICILLIILVGCAESDNLPATSPDTNNDPTLPPLSSTLILRDVFDQESDVYIQGEIIEFYFTVKNNTNNDITVNFGSTKQFDFYIESSGVEIWRSSDNLVFAAVLTTFNIPAQDTIIINFTWNQSLLGGDNIPVGNYTAYGSLLNQSPTAKYEFEIQ